MTRTKPTGLKSSNDLDSIPADALGPVPAVIKMGGKDLLTMEEPPQMGEFVKMEITMRCKDDGRILLADGGISHYRKMAFVGAKVTTEPYKPDPSDNDDPNQPGLYDAAGNGDGDTEDES